MPDFWMFGKKYNFTLYDCGIPLSAAQYHHDANGNAVRNQKNQIVLHFTAANHTGRQTVDGWNSDPGPHSAHYVVERAFDRQNAAQEYSDVVEVVDSDCYTLHGGNVNQNSIGIEHANVGTAWPLVLHEDIGPPQVAAFQLSAADHCSLEPGSHCPIHAANPSVCHRETQRPTDANKWLHCSNIFPGATSNMNQRRDYQAFQEEQYLAMILILRHLCIKHRIPRRFLGDTTEEKMQRWWDNLPNAVSHITQSKLLRFRGILSHMNCSDSKTCGGPAMHRNRLFRGIIDEWWLPLQFDGSERVYYTGPFDPQPNERSYFRWAQPGGAMQSELFHDADLDALQETKSYFNLNHLEWYYAQTENAKIGGTFPIGLNYSWHGGVHLAPPASNRKVYAAASGTIVAARLGGDDLTELDPNWGSQRFVLIRHCVYMDRQAHPGGGMGINYSPTPRYIFSLYMHLDSFAGDLGDPDPFNPPWFNYWRRRNKAADANGAFCPNVQVAVGDWLGDCGTYRGNQIIHFEVMSKDELTMEPWNDSAHRVYDPSGSTICTVPTMDRFVRSRTGEGLDTIDILAGARELRLVKSYHKSEWALSTPDALMPVLPGPFEAFRQAYWNRLKHFMWVADALAACPDLSSQLCDASGMMWHYHPIQFMEFINRLIVEENGQLNEPDLQDTNVALEDGYLTRFFHFNNRVEVPDAADAQPVKPFDFRFLAFSYHASRQALACSAPGPHDPGPTPPIRTMFHLTLLDLLETTRIAFAPKQIEIIRAHLCPGHRNNLPANLKLCVLGTDYALEQHMAGNAVDIRPAVANKDTCAELWNKVRRAADILRGQCTNYGGEPSRADLSTPFGTIRNIMISTDPSVQRKLEAGTPLSPGDVALCVIHVELQERQTSVVWRCWIRKVTRALQVRVEETSMSIIGVFGSQPDAEAEREKPSTVISAASVGFECVIRSLSHAQKVWCEGGGIIGEFATSAFAESEKESEDDSVWPKET